MDDIYENIEEHNPNKKRKKLTVFNDVIADMLNNKKLNPIVTELFIRGRKITFLPCFYYTVLFGCSQKYQTKFNSLFCYENSIQKRTSRNWI